MLVRVVKAMPLFFTETTRAAVGNPRDHFSARHSFAFIHFMEPSLG